MRQFFLIPLIASMFGSLLAYLPDKCVEGAPCTFSHECDCIRLADVGWKCEFGKCKIEPLPFGGIKPKYTECSSYKDCNCRYNPLNCRCDNFGKCQKGRVECQENSDCSKLSKCDGKECSCQGNTCEHQCSTTKECFDKKFGCSDAKGYTCKCAAGICEYEKCPSDKEECSQEENCKRICKPTDVWKEDCDFCPDGGSVMKENCSNCTCMNGEPYGCTKDSCKGPPCLCPKLYAPVCGINGISYVNPCEAKCAGVKVECSRKCPCDDCVCPNIFSPVCGNDGNTYDNSCDAECRGVKVDCAGKCPCDKPNCVCPEIYSPVCGNDGNEYDNNCLAECKGATVKCNGMCPCSGGPSSCYCPKLWKPVCGSDGKTHGNKCRAKCKGASIKCHGLCPCARKPYH